nr:hypothetical protein HmN_000599200 [Hymenolepis microstoma]
MSISPITALLLWTQNKQLMIDLEIKRVKSVERLIPEEGNENLSSICEEETRLGSKFATEGDEVAKVVDMMGDIIPEKENKVVFCEKVEETGENTCCLEIDKVTECTKEPNVRLLIAEFEKKLGPLQWNYDGKSKIASSTLSDKFVCSSENDSTSVEEKIS